MEVIYAPLKRKQEKSVKSKLNPEDILDKDVDLENDPDFTPSEIYLDDPFYS